MYSIIHSIVRVITMTNKVINKILSKKLFFLCSFFIVYNLSAERFMIDKIESVIYGPEETSIVTSSDLARIGLDGQRRTKDKLVFELLVYQDAKKYNIVDEKLVDRYIEAIQAQHNLSLDDLKKMFYEYGYTYEEGREQLAMFNTINQLLDFKVRSKVIIPEKEVKAYFDAHPKHQEESYHLQRIFMPIEVGVGAAEQESIKKDIAQKAKIGQNIAGAEYANPFWIENPDLSPDKKQFIPKLNIGESSTPQYYDGGFELFTLLDRKEKKLIPFEQRYREIVDTLRAPLFEKLFDDYKKSLYQNSVIVHRP